MQSTARNLGVVLVAAALGMVFQSSAAGAPPSFGDEKTSWHGFDRYDFLMDGEDLSIKPFKAPAGEGNAVRTQVKGQLRCVVVVPKKAATPGPGAATTSTTSRRPKLSCSGAASTSASSGATPASRGTRGTPSSPISTSCRRSRPLSA